MAAVRGWLPAWIGAGVMFVVAMTTPSVSLPQDELGLRRFPVDLASSTVSQTFFMTANGLEAVEIATAATGSEVSGKVRLDLYDVTDANFVHGAEVRAAEFVKEPVYRFTF